MVVQNTRRHRTVRKVAHRRRRQERSTSLLGADCLCLSAQLDLRVEQNTGILDAARCRSSFRDARASGVALGALSAKSKLLPENVELCIT
jgi:hypothetical protein